MGNSNMFLKERYTTCLSGHSSHWSQGLSPQHRHASMRPPGDGVGPTPQAGREPPTTTHKGAQPLGKGPVRRAGQQLRQAGSGLKHPSPAGSLCTPVWRPCLGCLAHLELLLLGHCHGHVSQEQRVSLLPDLVPVVLHAKPAQVVLLLCSHQGEPKEVRTNPSSSFLPSRSLTPPQGCAHPSGGTCAAPAFIS